MFAIDVHGAATLLYAREGLVDRLATLRRAPGFVSAAQFRPVAHLGDRVAYVRWTACEAANAAVDAGDRAVLRTAVIEPYAVRTEAEPDNERGRLELAGDGTTVLISAMSVDPARCDALTDTLRTATDSFLPGFRAVQGVAFHRSGDRTLVVEVLHVSGVFALGATQLTKRLRRHRRHVDASIRGSVTGIYRLQDTYDSTLT